LHKLPTTITPPPDTAILTQPKSLDTLVSDDELETTIDTLNLLSEYPNVIKSKQCKELRVAVYNFRQGCNTGINAACKTTPPSSVAAVVNVFQRKRILQHAYQQR
jgi:hypothetical protein